MISVLFSLCFIAIFSLSLYLKHVDPTPIGDLPNILVVQSDSMSNKHEENVYLAENNLNDQFNTFDIVLTYKLPDEYDLKLYDIVVYEVDGKLIIHRIIGIEEPNEKHPNERFFTLKGDNVKYKDSFPVLYSQMKAIYKGERIPQVGSFVLFLQSPAGVLCILLVIFYAFAVPILNKKIQEEELIRFYKYNDESTYSTIPNAKPLNKIRHNEKGKKKYFRLFLLFISLFLLVSISSVSAAWHYNSLAPNEYSNSYKLGIVWPTMSTKAESLADSIVNDATNGLNNSNSYLNDQIEYRCSTSGGGTRDTIGSMAVTQGDGLDDDFALTENGVDFLLQFVDENSDGTIDFYYLFITEVDLGERGERYWWGTLKTEGKPTTPIGEYIYPIFRFKVTKNSNGEWVAGPEEVGSAISAWYEESRSDMDYTQIPSFDPDTWVAGKMTTN